MKNKKKNVKLGILFLLSVLLINFAVADSCFLDVELVNQDPYPAIPGDYADVVFQVSGIENPGCSDIEFELVSSYPFTLESGESVKTLQGSTYLINQKIEWMIPYKLRIDEAAFEGNPEIKVEYSSGATTYSKYFNITVQDSRTTFDAVIQEVNGPEVSIALANTGKYGANSIIVRIPSQDNFKVMDNNGQMVGNLDTGDYTLVSFNLMSKDAQPGDNNLLFDIHYTDALGERRIASLEIPLRMMAGTSPTGAMVPGSKRSLQSPTGEEGGRN